MEIQQGTVLESEQVERLQEGMNRRQVEFLLGTPPIDDPFHADRWDYVYTLRREGRRVEYAHLAVYFDNDRVSRVERGANPAGD